MEANSSFKISFSRAGKYLAKGGLIQKQASREKGAYIKEGHEAQMYQKQVSKTEKNSPSMRGMEKGNESILESSYWSYSDSAN